jgi:hypothetical protein
MKMAEDKDNESLCNFQVGRISSVVITISPSATVCKRAALLQRELQCIGIFRYYIYRSVYRYIWIIIFRFKMKGTRQIFVTVIKHHFKCIEV